MLICGPYVRSQVSVNYILTTCVSFFSYVNRIPKFVLVVWDISWLGSKYIIYIDVFLLPVRLGIGSVGVLGDSTHVAFVQWLCPVSFNLMQRFHRVIIKTVRIRLGYLRFINVMTSAVLL